MAFRKMLMMTLYAEQKKRHRFIEQSFGLCGRRRGRDVSREQHRNICTVKGETDYRPLCLLMRGLCDYALKPRQMEPV